MKTTFNKKLIFRYGVFGFLLITIIIGTTAYINSNSESVDQKQDTESSQRKKMYVCSMEPWILRDEPGACPICGMALIEKSDQNFNKSDSTLNNVVCSVNEKVLASVKTVNPIQEELQINIEATGIINYDLSKVSIVCAHYSGLIEKSYVKYKFQPVIKGQKLYDIYCPEIYSAKINYINILKNFPGQEALVKEAKDWLNLLGLTDDQIKNISSNEKIDYHLSVYSDVDGYAVGNEFDPENEFSDNFDGNIFNLIASNGSSKTVFNEGILVETGYPLFKVINTSTVRADLKVRSEDAGLLKPGQKVILTDAISPGKKYYSTIGQIEPLKGSLYQLVKVYITDNSRELIPGKQIQAQIQLKNHNSLWVPKSSVINLGLEQIVFVRKENTLIATAVKTGLHTSDKIEINSGIDKNARIALNANLLIDSDGFIKVPLF